MISFLRRVQWWLHRRRKKTSSARSWNSIWLRRRVNDKRTD
jgi:hypothetical protein